MPTHRRKPPEISDEKERRIQAGIAKDPDNPELTEERFKRMRPASQAFGKDLYAALTRPRGRPKAETTKVPLKVRVDPIVISSFKATGAGWQTRINATLVKAAKKLGGSSPSSPQREQESVRSTVAKKRTSVKTRAARR